MPCLGQQRLEGYPRTEAGAPSRAPASGREITRSKPFFPAPFPAPCSKTLQEVVLGLAGKQPLEVFLAFRAGENFPSLSTSCLRMKNTAHSFILRQENPPIHGNTCLKMEIPATFFILRHKNESGRVHRMNGNRPSVCRMATECTGMPICPFCVLKPRFFDPKQATEWL